MNDKILTICEKINNVVWGPLTVSFFIFVGVYFTLKTKWFQITHFGMWIDKTLFGMFRKKTHRSGEDGKSISQFQAAATALAASVGTGNIVGVATAIVLGGPGAVFWMWVSAIFSMMTSFAENTLGAIYRYKDRSGKWQGGPMVYMKKTGMGALSYIFAFFCLISSLGIGNMSQINSISASLFSTFKIPAVITGIVFTVLVSLIIIGGIKRIAHVAEIIVPVMVAFYMIAAFICIFFNIEAVPGAFKLIFTEAFKLRSAACGVTGYGISEAVKRGVSRGIFSNEAGLGTAVIAHAASDEYESTVLGMWGMFEVFLDTIVVCTVTAIVILTSGAYNMSEYIVGLAQGNKMVTGAQLSVNAFEATFGAGGGVIISLSIVLFAFASIIGWCYYGETCTEYLLGKWAVTPYKIIFSAFVFVGAVMDVEVVWSISDIFNALMAVPNLIAVLLLSDKVCVALKKYKQRT